MWMSFVSLYVHAGGMHDGANAAFVMGAPEESPRPSPALARLSSRLQAHSSATTSLPMQANFPIDQQYVGTARGIQCAEVQQKAASSCSLPPIR